MFADEKNIIIRINECYYEVLLTLEIGIFRISLCNILQKNVNNTQRKFKFYQIYMSGVSFENKVNCDENKKKELKKNTIIEHVAVFRLKEISEQKKNGFIRFKHLIRLPSIYTNTESKCILLFYNLNFTVIQSFITKSMKLKTF